MKVRALQETDIALFLLIKRGS